MLVSGNQVEFIFNPITHKSKTYVVDAIWFSPIQQSYMLYSLTLLKCVKQSGL